MTNPKFKKPRIGTAELAGMLGCHQMSVPRYVRTKPGFPKPKKLFGKNLWDLDVVERYIESLVSGKAR
jgi:hypothetical protein